MMLPCCECVYALALAEREKETTDIVDSVKFAVVVVEDGEELLVDVWIEEFLDLADVLDGGPDKLGFQASSIWKLGAGMPSWSSGF
jgi:hypothetical protein